MSSDYSESSTDVENMPLREKSTRKRILKTKEDESSADEEFWNQEMFLEKPEDKKQTYNYEKPDTDNTDSDISEAVSDTEKQKKEVGQIADLKILKEERIRAKKNKSNVYKDPLLVKTTPRKKKRSSKQTVKKPIKKYTLRKSTAEKTDAMRQMKVVDFVAKKRRPRFHKPREKFSQEFLLDEAKKTELENKRSLEKMVEIESKKKIGGLKRRKVMGMYSKIHSTRDLKTLTLFARTSVLASAFPHEKRDTFYSSPNVCIVSGKKANYKEPTTNKPYYSVKEYQTLKELNMEGKLKTFDQRKLFLPTFVVNIDKPLGWVFKPPNKFTSKYKKFKRLTIRLLRGNSKSAIRIDLQKLRNNSIGPKLPTETEKKENNQKLLSPKLEKIF